MKKLLLTLLFPLVSLSQQLELNSDNKVYEYSHVKEYSKDKVEMINNFEKKLKELNYSDINNSNESLYGTNYFSFLILTTPVQVYYNVSINFKEDRYKLLINNFILEDRRYSKIPLEDLKSYTKKWVKKINEKLPQIVKSIESPIKDW